MITTNQGINCPLGGPLRKIHREGREGVTLLFMLLLLFRSGLSGLAERFLLQGLRNIVGDVFDHLHSADALCTEEIDGM